MKSNIFNAWANWGVPSPSLVTNRFKKGYKTKYDILVYPADKDIYYGYQDRKVYDMVPKGSHFPETHPEHQSILNVFLNDSNLGNNIVDCFVIAYYHNSKYYLVQLSSIVVTFDIKEKYKMVEGIRERK